MTANASMQGNSELFPARAVQAHQRVAMGSDNVRDAISAIKDVIKYSPQTGSKAIGAPAIIRDQEILRRAMLYKDGMTVANNALMWIIK